MGLRDVIARASDPATVMERVAEAALVLVPAAEGAAVWLAGASGSLVCAAGAGSLRGHLGTEVPAQGSLSGLAVRTGAIQRTSDATHDRRADRAAAAALGIASMICMPLLRGDRAVGSLQLASGATGAFGPGDAASLRKLTAFVSTVIGAAVELASVTEELLAATSPGRRSVAGHRGPGADPGASQAFVANVLHPWRAVDAGVHERIERVLGGSGLSVAFQPVVALEGGAVVEVEALARFAGPPEQGPDRWFAEAAMVGLCTELELRAVEVALGHLGELPRSVRMALNVGPETLCSSALLALLERSEPSRLVVELTEHVGVEDFARLQGVCRAVRALGARLAVDDTGTGFASLSVVLRIAPEVIKLDRELTGGIDADPVRRALAGALVGFGEETGAAVVAEGIETAGELEVLRGLGVPYGQGFFLARPGSMDDLHRLFGPGSFDRWCSRPGRRGQRRAVPTETGAAGDVAGSVAS